MSSEPSIESKGNPSPAPQRAFLAFFAGLVLSCASAFIPDQGLQMLISVAIFVLTFLLWRLKKNSEAIRRALMALTILASVRYILWRAIFTLNLPDFLTGTVSLLLYSAELYTVYMLIGFYFQIYSLDRSNESIEADPEFQPSVDIFIPTYNEDTDILRRTIVGAKSIDYANKKVFVLDDGNRPEMRVLAEELGCNYIIREKHEHAKAGNINNALKHTDGELILILDADHIPVTTLLSKLVPFFKDEKVSLVQSPHRFLNPGPVERNVYLGGKLPFEQELFMQIVQLGNDYWNASFFCGSAAMLRRSVLTQIGGIATETVTEDCHTSIRMHANGYKSRYFSVPQIIGLSPESLAGFVLQHCRWARGATQMMRIEMPPLKKGLSAAQRYCYFNGMLHFLFGIPRLIFYAAPISFLVFHLYPVRSSFFVFMVMGMSYIACSVMTNNYFFRNFRHSFWSDIYEAVLSPFYAVVTTLALFDPKSGKFNVTPKGTMTEGVYFDRHIAMPNIVIFSILFLTFVYGIVQLFTTPTMRDGILVNLFWTGYNLTIVGIAILCAVEQTFTRRAYRVRRKLNAVVTDSGGNVYQGSTVLTTEFGSLVRVEHSGFNKGDLIKVVISGTVQDKPISVNVEAEVRYVETANGAYLLGLQYRNQTSEALSDLIRLSYCEAKLWEKLHEPDDKISLAFWTLVSTPARVFAGTKNLIESSSMPAALPENPPALGVSDNQGN